MVSHITPSEARRRAARLRLVLTDCDGVLTDGGVYYSARGEELKRFSIRDGMGVERLRKDGLLVALVTGEVSPSVALRAEKLHMRAFLGVKDKAARFEEIRADFGVKPDEVAFIGDDVNDLGLIADLAPYGLVGAPADAMPEVAAHAHYQALAGGGHGAFRQFAEWLLLLRREAREAEAAQAGR